VQHQSQLADERCRQDHEPDPVVLAHADEEVPDPTEAEEVAGRRTIAEAGHVPRLMLHNVLPMGERHDESRIEVVTVGVPPGGVVQVVGGTAEKYALLIVGTHQAARPDL
jgi:hypothetical protein